MAKAPAKIEKTFEWKTDTAHVSVRSVSRNGYWCAGRKFGPEPEFVAKADLTDAQAEELTTDPYVVTLEQDPPAARAPSKTTAPPPVN